ncbi:MAG: EAL domain-containing protein [Pseudomonadota bacterium]
MSFKILQNEVPKQLKLADQRRMLSRVALSISLVLTVYLIIVCIVMPVWTIGKSIAALAAILIGSLSILCHREKLYTASAATIVATTIIGGFVASLSNGGADGFVAPIMISAPLVAAVFIGARATVISAVLVVLAIVSLYFLESVGFVTEAPYSADTLNIAAIIMLSASTAICASGVGYFASAMQTQIVSLIDSQEQLVDLSEQLDHSAHHDALTKIANRHGLQRHLEQLLTIGRIRDQSICLIHVDLDNFKTINDTHGHPVGDAVLKHAADVMRRGFSGPEIVSRVGGDEFVIVYPVQGDSAETDAQMRCDQLISDLGTSFFVDTIECRIGASIGFTVSKASHCSIDTLMTDADLALYDAKRDGRGKAQRFVPEMREKLKQHQLFSVEVEHALADNRVECVLQPQICLRSGEITGMEGLGRIRSASGDLLPPAKILPVLAEMGRLIEFDHKVMQQSLDALVAIRRAGFEMPYVSVNASSESLRSADYVSRISIELEKRNLHGRDVIVEILESTLIENLEDPAAKSIHQLRLAGIQAIMDDFGSEHATLSNLLKLDVDGFKIDRSLIANLEDKKTYEVVQGVHSIAHNLGLAVIVEGVESAPQFALLQRIGCETVQGFGICRPLELEKFCAWIESYGVSDVSRQLGQLT